MHFRFHEWHPALQTSAITDEQVHVWRASLALPASQVRRPELTLEAGELSRAERFHLDQDRQNLVVARGLLRAILGQYQGMEASQVRWRLLCSVPSLHGRRQKPSLAAGAQSDLAGRRRPRRQAWGSTLPRSWRCAVERAEHVCGA